MSDYPYKKMKTTKLPSDHMDKPLEKENPYLIMGFWKFAIIATLTVAFFPLSLLFSLLFFGMDGTMFLLVALFHDFVKTLLAILAIVIPIAILIIYLII
jgi:uncharacterized protein involved in cysteine biosynthesis